MEKAEYYEFGALERTLGQPQRTEMTDLGRRPIHKAGVVRPNSKLFPSFTPGLQSRGTAIASLNSFIQQTVNEYQHIRKGRTGRVIYKKVNKIDFLS